jgi:hypothetical protein
MTAILGRMATYSGQMLEFDKVLNAGLDLQPKAYDFNARASVLPDADGRYKVAVPGVTKYT